MDKRVTRLAFCIAAFGLNAAAQTVTSSGTAGTVGNVPYISAASSTSTTLGSSPITVSGSAVRIAGDMIPGGNGVLRAVVPLAMGGGDANISLTTWQRVTRTTYSWTGFFEEFTGVAVLPGATRQYYLIVRKADGATTAPGSNWRFACDGYWNGGNDVPGHGFTLSSDWGYTDEGSTQWVQVPPTAVTVSGCATPYWKIDAEMSTSGSMRVMSVSMAAVDVYGGTTPVYSAASAGNDAFPALSALYDNVWSTGPYSGGNVGIGTAGPAYKLDVAGQIHTSSGVVFPDGTTQATAFNPSAGLTLPAGITVNSTAAGQISEWVRGSASGDANLVLSAASGNGNAFWFTATDNILQIGGIGNNEPAAGAINVLWNGDVGIGTTSPQAALEINGSLRFTADGSVQTSAWTGVLCGGDYAESVDVTGNRTNYEPGDVLVLDGDNPGKMLKSIEAYSSSVSGIYSTKPGTVGRRQTTAKSPDEVPMAVIGIVPAKVSAENGPIKVGDLLVTSSTSGYAMKGTDRSRMLGAVVGKAMAKLETGTGVIEVLVTLQ